MSGHTFEYENLYSMQTFNRIPPSTELQEWNLNFDPALKDYTMDSMNGWNQQPMQRYMDHPERPLFNVGHQTLPQTSHPSFYKPYEAEGSLPHVSEVPRDSPTPSNPQSSIGSTSSPMTEHDWAQDAYFAQQNILSQNITRNMSYYHGDRDSGWPQKNTHHSPAIAHLVMSDIQGFSDPQDPIYQHEEGYLDIEPKFEYPLGPGEESHIPKRSLYNEPSRVPKIDGHDFSFRNTTLKDTTVPQRVVAVDVNNLDVDVDTDRDADAEFDLDPDVDADSDVDTEENLPIETEDDDTEYIDRPSRSTNHRKSSRIQRSSRTKKVPKKFVQSTHRVTKSKPRTAFQCTTCDHKAKDTQGLLKHVSTAHTRAFRCEFSFAGCPGAFGSKNEWKRHVTSQHLGLSYYQCRINPCNDTKSKSPSSRHTFHDHSHINTQDHSRKSNTFNRKDLFTQHLRRMHAPPGVKHQAQKKKIPEWEAQVKKLQNECLVQRRKAPGRSICPVTTCRQLFEGEAAWELRMEHVGRHFERDEIDEKSGTLGEDELLISWAEREGIVERRGDRWEFCGDDMENPQDADADGDEDDGC